MAAYKYKTYSKVPPVDLYTICLQGDTNHVENLVCQGVNVNRQNQDGLVGLHYACERAELNLVKLFINHGADINIKNNLNKSPVDFLIGNLGENAKRNASDCDKIVKLLMRRMSRSEFEFYGSKLLVSACMNGLKTSAELLIIRIDRSKVGGFERLLWGTVNKYTAERSDDYIKVIQVLLKYGVNIDAEDTFERTSLCNACCYGHTDIVRILLQNGANVNGIRTEVPIVIASRQGRREIFKHYQDFSEKHVEQKLQNYAEITNTLIEYGADVDTVDRFNCTPLYNACYNENAYLVKILLKHGADPNGKQNAVPLIAASKQCHVEIVNLLLCYGANANAQNEYGHTALQEVVQVNWQGKINNVIEIVSILLFNGAEVNVSDRFGVTPLCKACQKGNTEVVHLLLACRADTTGVPNAHPLTIACETGNVEIVRMLLESGADAFPLDIHPLVHKLFDTEFPSKAHLEIIRFVLQYTLNFDLYHLLELILSTRKFEENGVSYSARQSKNKVPLLSEKCRNTVRLALKNQCQNTTQYRKAVKSLCLPKILEDIIVLRCLP